jgi:hypothetical protein
MGTRFKKDFKMNILVFYSDKNSKGKHDATGAFIPEAKAFQKYHEIPKENMIPISCTELPKHERRTAVYEAIEEAGKKKKLDMVVFFGHGWPGGIQFGFKKRDIPQLAHVIHKNSFSAVRIVLYACLTAENSKRDREIKQLGPATDGGFSDLLRDELMKLGCVGGWIDAHKTFGHTTWNPYCVRFYCEEVDEPEFGAIGGAWLVQPRSEYWSKWVRAMKHSMRFRFPFLSELEIKAELAGIPWTGLVPK